MPFKSKAQIAKFKHMVEEGRISQKEFDAWMDETPNPDSLPERVKKVAKAKTDKAPKVWYAKVYK